MEPDEGQEESKELVGTNPSQRNWRGILIAILVILIVLSLIVVAVILVTPKEDDVFLGEAFTFDDMFNEDLQPRKFNAKWIGDKNIYVYRSREGEVMEYKVELNKTTIIMDNSTFRELNTDVYFVSEDLQYVLIAYQVETIFRHSFLAKYKIYNRNANNPKEKLLDFPQSLTDDWRQRKLQYAGWSTVGHRLTFVYNNNLYYQKDPLSTPTEFTSTDNKYVYNGIADWLYEEEILHSQVAHWWSPDCSFIAYAQLDDTEVPKYRFPYYGDGSDIYGSMDEVSYPKAGYKGANVNPKVTIYLVDIVDSRVGHRRISPPVELQNQDVYITSVVWQDENTLMVVWLNRAQNVTIVQLCDALFPDCHTNLIETSKGHGWISMPTPRFIEGGQTYLTVLPGRDGHHGYWKHVTMVTAPHGAESGRKTVITQGTFDVLKLVGFDEEQKTVYFLSNYLSDINAIDPRKRHLYTVGISDSDVTLQEPECITCNRSPACQYVDATFSHSGRYYVLACLGPGIPTYTLYSTLDDREIVVEDNVDVKARLDKKALPDIQYMEIEHPTKGYVIWAKLLIPKTVNKEHIIKYQLLVHTYAAPETQKVTEEFRVGWETVMVSSHDTIYMVVDGRGSLGRGDEWLHELYKQLGTKEVEDQILAAEYLSNKIHYIDQERIAIWGWSYGGFVTTHVLGDKSKIFHCGIAVAPVTDWRYYDTAYAEKYMGLSNLEENFRGYDNANVSRKAEQFRGKKIMIVHGTADDNVHFQHTAQFIKALTAADIDFRIQVYSDKNHALTGPKTSRHLYRTMMSFLDQACWHGGRPLDPSKKPTDEDEQYDCSSS